MAGGFYPGALVGRYQIEAEVGRGGMGVVYRAVDPALNRTVALKVLAQSLDDHSTAYVRFQREATAIASLKHANIATVYEFGEHEGRPFIVLEWIEGQTLKSLLAAQGALSLERALGLADPLGAALDYAHQRGVIHRDIKPANIIVGARDHVTLVDFGLAWLAAAPSITLTGSIFGTPHYMAPEQIRGSTVDGRADLYSLGVIVYEMLAGRPLFEGNSPPVLLHHHLYTPPPPITESNPSLPASVETALLKALTKEPSERFQTAAEFGRALRAPDSIVEPQINAAADPLLIQHATSTPDRLEASPSELGIGLAAAPPPTGPALPAAAVTGRHATAASPGVAGLTGQPTRGAWRWWLLAILVIGGGLAWLGVNRLIGQARPSAAPTLAADVLTAHSATAAAVATVGTEAATSTIKDSAPIEASPTVSGQGNDLTATAATPAPTDTPGVAPTPTLIAPPTYSMPAGGSVWPMGGGGPARCGFVTSPLARVDPSPRWSRDPHATGTTGPVVGAGLVVFGVAGGVVQALDWNTGLTAWVSRLQFGEVTGELALFISADKSRVLLSTDDGALHGLNLADGTLGWSERGSQLHSATNASLTIDPSGIAYVATDAGWLDTVNALSGEVISSTDLSATDTFSLAPSLSGSTLYLPGNAQAIHAVNRTTLQVQWTAETLGNVSVPLCLNEERGLVVAGTDKGMVQAFNNSDGSRAWTGRASAAITGLANDGTRVYAAASDGTVYAWKIDSGEAAWALNTGASLSAAPLTDGRYVLVATQAGDVRFLQAATGTEVTAWRLALGDGLAFTPALAGGWLFVHGGSVYGLGP